MSEVFSPEAMLSIYRAAEDDLGIYPQSVTRDGVTTPRTEFGEGWNNAIMTISKNRVKIIDWIKDLPTEEQTAVLYLLSKDVLSLNIKDDKIDPWIVLNDVFGPAADGEGVSLEEIRDIHNIHLKYNWDGVVAWFSNKLGNQPWTSSQRTTTYQQALKELQQETGK